MLEQLQQNFIAELRDSMPAESNTAHASSMKVEDSAVSPANGQAVVPQFQGMPNETPEAGPELERTRGS